MISWYVDVLFLRLCLQISTISWHFKLFFAEFGKDFLFFRFFRFFAVQEPTKMRKNYEKIKILISNRAFLKKIKNIEHFSRFCFFSRFLRIFFDFRDFRDFRDFSSFRVKSSLQIDHLSFMKWEIAFLKAFGLGLERIVPSRASLFFHVFVKRNLVIQTHALANSLQSVSRGNAHLKNVFSRKDVFEKWEFFPKMEFSDKCEFLFLFLKKYFENF